MALHETVTCHVVWDTQGFAPEVTAHADDPGLAACVHGVLALLRMCPRVEQVTYNGHWP
jgi:hypothetical protein